MIKKSNYLPVLNVILFLLFIGPFIYVANFIFPSTDDFCMASKIYESFGSNFTEWYNSINGRYINALFSLMPVYELTVYRLIVVSLLLLLGVSLFWFVQSVFSSYNLQFGFQKKILLSLLMYIVLVAQLPSLFEIFYWYAGAGPYLLSFIFLLFFLGCVLLFILKREINIFLLAPIIIFINGNNEMLIILSNFLVLLLLLWNWAQERKCDKKLLLLNIISWLSSLAFFLSPGTISRRGFHEYGGNFIGSVKVAVFYGAKFIASNLVEIPYLIFYIILFLWVYNSKKDTIKHFINPFHLLVISYLSIISIFFVVYYATGLFGVYEGRIGNMADMVVFIFAFLNIFNFAVYLRSKGFLRVFGFSYYIPILSTIFLVFLIVNNENYVNVRKDITEKNLIRYKDDMETRFQVLEESDEKTIILEPIEGTRILKSGDKYYVGQEWLQYCYKEYINKYLGKNFDKINIDI